MRLIYICNECKAYIDEIQLDAWDESRLGFDVLTEEDREELLHVNWEEQVGTVMAICDECLEKISKRNQVEVFENKLH